MLRAAAVNESNAIPAGRIFCYRPVFLRSGGSLRSAER